MPVAMPEALTHIEITVLRQINENITTQTRHLEALTTKVEDVRDRVIRIEAAELKKKIERAEARILELESEKADAKTAAQLEARVNELEAERDRLKGATNLVGWASRNAPWLLNIVAYAAAAVYYFRTH